jgi:hypothetical protein
MSVLMNALTYFCKDCSISEYTADLKACFLYYKKKSSEFHRDFYKTTIDSNDDIKNLIQRILESFGIPKTQWGRYLPAKLTVYEFLLEIHEQSKKENEKIKIFFDLVEHEKQRKWKKIFYGSLLALALLEGLLPLFAYLGSLTVIQELLAAALFFPLVGLCFTIGTAVYSFYKNLSDNTISVQQRIRNYGYLLAQSVLKVAAYAVLIAAVATTTPLVSVLFVAAGLLDVVKEVVGLIRLSYQYKKREPIPDDAPLNCLQQHAREEAEFVKRRNLILIKLGSALVSSAIVLAWCLIPGSIFLALGVLALMGLVALGEFLLEKYNERSMRRQLQTTFDKIEADHGAKATLENVCSPAEEYDCAENSELSLMEQHTHQLPGRLVFFSPAPDDASSMLSMEEQDYLALRFRA